MLLIIFLILIFIVLPIATVWTNIQYFRAEKISCPHCGKVYRLMNGSYKCPKCKTRVTRTADGDLVTS
ncbi:DUF2614 family zinc ribbon-containing protein [Paenibacillus xylanilyticus]|uniref:DUF2614 family zinc ribbon-containing protein n=1 Tax=Paenibacillus xylanilyticus TaxID=248903 RepID=UPI003AAD5EF3